jgi:hypothetical protein
MFEECHKGVTRVLLQECYRDGTIFLQSCYKSVKRVSQMCYRGVTEVPQRRRKEREARERKAHTIMHLLSCCLRFSWFCMIYGGCYRGVMHDICWPCKISHCCRGCYRGVTGIHRGVTGVL